MLFRIQEKFRLPFQEALVRLEQSQSFFEEASSDNVNADLLVGDVHFLKKQKNLNNCKIKILVTSEEETPSLQAERVLAEIGEHSRLYLVKNESLNQLQNVIEEVSMYEVRQQQIQNIKTEIQKKRKELEALNSILSNESEKKIESLEISHLEETEKNQNEKNLLHFLDFNQTESLEEDFIEKLFRFIWKDLKKITRAYQIGISTQSAHAGKVRIACFDGNAESTSIAQVDFKNSELAQQLAVVWGRPVGKIFCWQLPRASKEAYFFLEVVNQHIQLDKIQSYFSERLTVLSMYLDRWMIEQETKVVLDRWKKTFQSFSGYVHVIDADFKLYQSNYDKTSSADFCYKVLAGRTTPCDNCPVLKEKNTTFLLKENCSVKTYYSQFKLGNKKYFFIIYEDITKLLQLHSHIIQTEKMSMLGRLGNHLAHELNNPLTGIQSYIQTLLKDEALLNSLPQTAKSDLQEILKASIRCQKIIKNFIDFSHKKEPVLEVTSFSEVLNNTLVLLKTALRSHRLFIDLKEDRIRINAHDLQQVLFNLIKNACEAMPNIGSLKIYQETKDRHIYFHIEDTGSGFRKDVLENAFQAFKTTKDPGEGTGLGLYLSKKLMNNMGADLLITASSDRGTKMSLVFEKI